LFEAPSSPIRFFGSEVLKGADNPRSFLGNLIEKSETPGPGAYVLRPGMYVIDLSYLKYMWLSLKEP